MKSNIIIALALLAWIGGCQGSTPLTPCERDLLHAHTACMGKVQVFTDGAGLFAVCSEHTPGPRWLARTERDIRERGMEALVAEHRAHPMGTECRCWDARDGEAGPVHACMVNDPREGL